MIYVMCSPILLLTSDLINRSLQCWWVGTNNLRDLLAVLEDNECWHGTDAKLLCYIWDLIHIDLDEFRIWVCLGELDNLRSDNFARPTPGCEAVENDNAVIFEDGRKLILVSDIVNTHSGGCSLKVPCESICVDVCS